MTTTTTPRSAASRRKARGELLVAGTVAAIGLVVLVRTATMDVPDNGAFLGPQFFPYLVSALLLALSALLVVQHLRAAPADATGSDTTDVDAAGSDGADAEGDAGPGGTGSGSDGPPAIDWKPFGLVAATLVLHVVLLEPLGWLIAGAGLFFGVSYALGGRNVLRDLGVAFVMSSVAQLAFSAGLGMSLPAGILGAVV
ncbi:putative tricarboxylic transport membrane protein [Prauserella aidingensis]|uniref:tripartite tricarboxylate transporter TctB family protein n=1 Tax=Prauserella aidingensis TaxID=387890 RepID=UPI0020A56396|nr:tripartite tricarboxylate transporter TctB family protein [Prauserella aidingensis]MCP2254298.1 putative tricarboxylic transport membrane protein [Prauserella aidingensis]